jgi:hypothetical protein
LFSSARPHTAVIPAKAGIQYAATYRSDRWRLWNTGSSAFADDDSRGMTQLHDLAARFARGWPSNFLPLQTEGVGNAGCTPHPRSRVQMCTKRRTRAYRAAEASDIPCAMVLRLISCFPRSGRVRCHRRRRNCFHQLDASVGASGPHDFAARLRHGKPVAHIGRQKQICLPNPKMYLVFDIGGKK